MENQEMKSKLNKRRVGITIMLFAVGVDLLGVSIILPILPQIGKMYNAPSVMIGFIYTAYAIAQTISNPITGKLSDKFGRRTILIGSLIGSITGFLLMGITLQLGLPMWVFLCFRFVAGMAGSTPPVAKSYIADVTATKERPFYYSLFGSVLGASFAIGPVIGGLLAQISLAAPLFGGAMMSLLGLLAAIFLFKDAVKGEFDDVAPLIATINHSTSQPQVEMHDITVHEAGQEEEKDVVEHKRDRRFTSVIPPSGEDEKLEEARKEEEKKENERNIERRKFTSVIPPSTAEETTNISTSTAALDGTRMETKNELSALPKIHVVSPMPTMLYALYLCQFFNSCAFAGYLTVFPLFISFKFNYGSLETGFFFTFTSAVYVIVQLFGFARIVRKIGKHAAGIVGACLFSIGLILIPLVPSEPLTLGVSLVSLFLFILSIGFGLAAPSLPSLISRYASRENMGQSLGLGDACDSLARIVAPLLLTALSAYSFYIPFFLAGAFGFVNVFFMNLILCKNKKIHLEIDTEYLQSELEAAQMNKQMGANI